jgi:hypothetical protein
VLLSILGSLALADIAPTERRDWSAMNYRNTEMKLDQIVAYLNDEKINLSPAFQRGHVWPLTTRRKLIANIVLGKPIPAIFLYKEASGSRYSYNILDGKQRLESLILFIGSQRTDFAIRNWARYFFPASLRKGVNFWIQLPNSRKTTFASLDEHVVRDFREYAIPTVEINLTDESHLDEIISLFVDINQQGVKVSRFDIVKAMGENNKLLNAVFDLIALEQSRGQDTYYKPKNNDFTYVLRTMQIIAGLSDSTSQVDRMWERLLEIVLFSQTRKHRKPVDILKGFISHDAGPRRGTKVPRDERFQPLTKQQAKSLKATFRFLAGAYKGTRLRETSLATDQTRFYTMVTTLIDGDLMQHFDPEKLLRKLIAFGDIVDGRKVVPQPLKRTVSRYVELASDRTTDTPRREERQEKFTTAVSAL